MIYRFGDFQLDSERLELRCGPAPRALEPQVFSLLLFLIENHARVVGKDELIDHVWHGRIVSDATLNSRINTARRAVDDSGKEQAVIRTYPRRGFRFVAEVTPEGAAAPASGADQTVDLSLPGKPSIAVLPFHNQSGDPEQDYFADGISEDIITALSRMRWLFVISRNSSFIFKGRTVDAREVSRVLGVRYVLEGSIRKAGRRVRITGELVDAATGHHIWAEKYDGDLEDVFSLQDAITASISTTLSSEITLAEIARVRKKRPGSFDAWDHYIHALPLMHQLEPEANDKAKRELQAAIDIDPEFVPPHVGLAWCCALEAMHGWRSRGRESLEQADRHARKAMALDDNDPRAHCALALAHFWLGRSKEAVATALRAISLDANMPEAHGILGCALAVSGRPGEAFESLERALRGSPRDPIRWFWYHGMANAHFAAEDYEQAIEWARQTADLRPGWAFGHLVAAASAALLGRIDEAKKNVASLRSVIPHYTLRRFRRNPVWTRDTEIERLADGLRKAGLAE